MKIRVYDHIDLRVRDRARAQEFFGAIMPALGFGQDESSDGWGSFATEGAGAPFFGFTEDKQHRANENRIAFYAESREEVDRIARIVAAAGGRNPEGPQLWSEYSPGYYAFFFEDLDGNKFEVCSRAPKGIAQ